MTGLFQYHHDANVESERNRFWIVCAISNPERFRVRYDLYKAFKNHVIDDLKCNLCVVECAHGDRAFQVTDGLTSPHVVPRVIEVQVRNNSHIWTKECLWNIGVSRLPEDAAYVMFCDTDLTFHNSDVVTDTIHALQVHKVVQPFQDCVDKGPHGEVLEVHKSFGWCHSQNFSWTPPVFKKVGKATVMVPDPYSGIDTQGYKDVGKAWHPGYCIAMKMTTLKSLRGLLDVGILGASDHHMMLAFIGKAHFSYPRTIHDSYKQTILDWQDRALDVVKKDLGYVRGMIGHAFHGAKAKRGYISRWTCLTEHNFDPIKDVYKNIHGVWELAEHNIGLRDSIRSYFRSRSEDTLVT